MGFDLWFEQYNRMKEASEYPKYCTACKVPSNEHKCYFCLENVNLILMTPELINDCHKQAIDSKKSHDQIFGEDSLPDKKIGKAIRDMTKKALEIKDKYSGAIVDFPVIITDEKPAWVVSWKPFVIDYTKYYPEELIGPFAICSKCKKLIAKNWIKYSIECKGKKETVFYCEKHLFDTAHDFMFISKAFLLSRND